MYVAACPITGALVAPDHAASRLCEDLFAFAICADGNDVPSRVSSALKSIRNRKTFTLPRGRLQNRHITSPAQAMVEKAPQEACSSASFMRYPAPRLRDGVRVAVSYGQWSQVPLARRNALNRPQMPLGRLPAADLKAKGARARASLLGCGAQHGAGMLARSRLPTPFARRKNLRREGFWQTSLARKDEGEERRPDG